MEDKLELDCGDIKKRLKPFLEDLLAEEEYQAYASHLNSCAKCKDYVGRFGSISNQLWELGNIKAPSDLSYTVSFNISEPAEDPQAPKKARIKNLIAGIVILVVVSAGAFAGAVYFKKHGSPHNADGSPIVTAQMIKDGGAESEALINELRSIATSLGVPDKKEEAKSAARPASSASGVIPAKKNIVTPLKVKPLHWHFKYNESSGDTGSGEDREDAELKIQKEIKAREALIAEMALIKQKTEPVEFGKQYSKAEQDARSSEALQAALELRNKQKELDALESGIKGLKEEKQGAEDLKRRSSDERRRKEADRKGKLLNAITGLGIKLEYQNYDILAFTATGEESKSVLSQILSISADSFEDFTSNLPTFPDKEQAISIYLPNGPEGALHWHASGLGKKAELFDAIRGTGGSIDHEAEGFVVFSISSAELKNLRVRIQAIGLSLTEYGARESRDGILISGPVAVSIYFTN